MVYRYGKRETGRMRERDRFLAAQGGRCAICRVELAGWGDACLDHDHATGVNRGVLCAPCNKGLGNFEDNEVFLLRAIRYLQLTSKLK